MGRLCEQKEEMDGAEGGQSGTSGETGGCNAGLPLGVLSLCAAFLPVFPSFPRRKKT
jgi:hypothetical protein